MNSADLDTKLKTGPVDQKTLEDKCATRITYTAPVVQKVQKTSSIPVNNNEVCEEKRRAVPNRPTLPPRKKAELDVATLEAMCGDKFSHGDGPVKIEHDKSCIPRNILHQKQK